MADDPWWSVQDSFAIVYCAAVDVLSDLLHRARAKNAVVRQLIQRPPWSITLADPQPLSAVATLKGNVTISLQNTDTRAAAAETAVTHTVGAGDIVLIKGGEYTIADDPKTPRQVIIRDGIKHIVGTAEEGVASAAPVIASRTFGDRQPGAIVMLHGIYELHGSAGDRLLDMLPEVTVVPAGPRTRGPLELLSAEAERDEPGQDAVLNRLLDLVLVIALRSWGTSTESELPTWLGAITDPAIGEAPAMLHADPRQRWTTATLANKVACPAPRSPHASPALSGSPP